MTNKRRMLPTFSCCVVRCEAFFESLYDVIFFNSDRRVTGEKAIDTRV